MNQNEYITAAQWVTDQIQDVLSDIPNCIESDPSVELAMRCYEHGLEICVAEDPTITLLPDEFLTKGLSIGEAYWEIAVDLLHEVHPKVKVERIGFIYTMSMVYENSQPNSSDLIDIETHDAFCSGMIKAVENLINERFSYIMETEDENPDILPEYEIPTDEEIDKILENSDQNLISRFFYLFKELKTFHVDPSRYETEEEVEKQKEMLAIFYKIFKMGKQ